MLSSWLPGFVMVQRTVSAFSCKAGTQGQPFHETFSVAW